MTPTEVGWLWNWADDEEAVAPNDKQAEPYRKVKNLCKQHAEKMVEYFSLGGEQFAPEQRAWRFVHNGLKGKP